MSAALEGGLANENINPPLLESRNKLLVLKAQYERSAAQAHEGWLFDNGDRGPEAFALARLVLDQNPDLQLRVPIRSEFPRKAGVYFNYGVYEKDGFMDARAWVEISREGQTIFILPTLESSGPTFSEQTVDDAQLSKVHQKLGLRVAPMEDLRLTSYWLHHYPMQLENILESPGQAKVPWLFEDWWKRFREAQGFYRATPEIENFANRLPHPDRNLAIEVASQKRTKFLLGIWGGELKKLPPEVVHKHGLTPDWAGWEKYIALCFDTKSSSHQSNMPFDEWSIKFYLQMLDELERSHGDQETNDGPSYFDLFTSGRIGLETIWGGKLAPIDPRSLLVHSLEENALVDVVSSGLVGRSGRAKIAMCEDRIVYDRGWIIVFQAGDLLKAGYPLVKIEEDWRDADIIREWRSMPVDINLARLVVSSSVVPDIGKIKHNPQIVRFHCGEDFLKGIERI